MTREAFGAEFLGADGFLNSPTYGLPPQFLVDALLDCIGKWQNGTMDVPSFDEHVAAGRAGYAALTGVPVDSVAMGGTVSAVLGLVAAAIPDGAGSPPLPGEFTSTTFPFAAQAGRGVTVTELPADELVTAAADFDVVDSEPGAVGQRCGARHRRPARARGGHRDADGHRHHAGARVETRRTGLGRRHRGRGLQVVAVAAGHGVDVVERQDESHHDTPCRQLVCGRRAVADDLRAAASAGRRRSAVRPVAHVVQCPWRRADAMPWLASLDGDAVRSALPGAGQPPAGRTGSAAAGFGHRLATDRGRGGQRFSGRASARRCAQGRFGWVFTCTTTRTTWTGCSTRYGPSGSAPTGIVAISLVPPSGGPTISSRPASASTRSLSPMSPVPPPTTAPPTPSSLISR